MESKISVVRAKKGSSIWWYVDNEPRIFSDGRFFDIIPEGDWYYLLLDDTDILARVPIM